MPDELMMRIEEIRRLRFLVDHLPAMIGYWDHRLRNVFANESYAQMHGWTSDELLGMHMREALGEALFDLNLPQIEGALVGQTQLFERTFVDRDKTTRHAEVSFLPDVVDGRVQGFYAQVLDVTERVNVERARNEAVRLWQISMDNAPFGECLLT